MDQAYVRVSFERIGDTTAVPDLVTPAGKDLADAIGDYVAEHRGDTAFTLHLTDLGGWIDAGTCNAGSFTIVDDPPPGTSSRASDDQVNDGAEMIDPWMFPPVDPEEHRRRDDETGRRRWWP